MKEIAQVFLKLGCVAFGGPAAHIAMMQEELVEKRKWLTQKEFLSYIGLTQLIPGPNSSELVLHLGYVRKGMPGLLLAGICFLAPALLSTWILAWVYVTYGKLPSVANAFIGIQAMVLVIIFSALLKLAKKQFETGLWLIFLIALTIMSVLGLAPWWLIIIGGLLFLPTQKAANSVVATPVLLASTASTKAISGSGIFWVFLKIGSILFGSGYVLVAYLEQILIQDLGWINQQQLLDSIALGQFTPGPVLSTATFIGYILNGNLGALMATVGIFLPAFVLVSLSGPLISKLKNKPLFERFLKGVNLAALAIFIAAFIKLTQPVLFNPLIIVVASLGALLHFKFKWSAPKLILVGLFIGVTYYFFIA